MSEKWRFEKGRLRLPKFEIDVSPVEFEIDVWEDDLFSEETPPPQGEYIDGTRLIGTLTADVWFNSPKITGKNVIGELQLTDPDYPDDRTCIRVMLLDVQEVLFVIPDKHKRHVWSFIGLGRPLHDKIGIFPERCSKPRLKMFLVPDFVGYFNIQGNGIVVAQDNGTAKGMFDQALTARGLAISAQAGYSLLEVNPNRLRETMVEHGLDACQQKFDLTAPCAVVLTDGSE